jgi:carbon storage regulator
MLVLTREPVTAKVTNKDEIIIGDNIIVKILRVEGNRVRVGIIAPGNVGILRGELVIDRDNQQEPLRGEAA